MKEFEYYQPTRIIFGAGKVNKIGEITAQYGKKAVLVTEPVNPVFEKLFSRVKESLKEAGVEVIHFDQVKPNPTTEIVSVGARTARDTGADVVIGLGGGSSMDTAKAIAVEAAHNGTAWDYLFYKKEPTSSTLPIVCAATTSGTGSQTTPCAVITKTEDKDKSAIWHDNIFPKAAIIDPEITATMPPRLTAVTGFDAFCHNFEACISVNSSPYVETLSLNAIKRIVQYLPRAVEKGDDSEARANMCWADTLGGLSFAAAGVTLPHGIGMQISGHCPAVAHGEALAVQYPAFTRFTRSSAAEKFAAVGRIFNPELETVTETEAAEACCEEIDKFLKKIGLWIYFKSLGISEEQVRSIANAGQVLPDYKNNPRIASIDEMYALLMDCFERETVICNET
jgi:alcohol dehydrogenase class IV